LPPSRRWRPAGRRRGRADRGGRVRACTVPNPPSPMITSECAALNRARRSS
jgi:hypothetical protein